MGVKDLWTVLTPHAERKPICELRGKKVAIDLAGWVCESLNVVDYFVHPRHHLKNLFFRTCYLIWEDVTPVFVLEGVAPRLKSQVIAKRNEVQFRGVKPKEKISTDNQTASDARKKDKGRTRFNHVLKQCEVLLQAMGVQCVQGPGEAEAYCAFLNKSGIVDGVVSQDSDCFAYGAVRVYRNFSVSTQGALAAQGGAVDIYDMQQISSKIDFGQNKVIVMALLCGCDYCPDGVGGVGRDSVLKLFSRYSDRDILEHIRNWRREDDRYTTLEMRVDDKTVCTNCGHMGRTQSHSKNGCGVCRTNRGCDENLWKEERLLLKAELSLRKKALANASFPSEEIIKEFLSEPAEVPNLQLNWRQPNVVKFVKQIGPLLQWPEIYCFRKFLPLLTRWRVQNAQRLRELPSSVDYVVPKEIVKKRVVKGVPSLEVFWQDQGNFFNGLIPDDQLRECEAENPTGLQNLWSTVEPMTMMEVAYPHMVEEFKKSKEKPKQQKKQRKLKLKSTINVDKPLGSLENLTDLITEANNIVKTVNPQRVPKTKQKGLQMIDKYFKQKVEKAMAKQTQTQTQTPTKGFILSKLDGQCSTPITKCLASDLESDDEIFDMSDIVNGIVSKTEPSHTVTSHAGLLLHYEPVAQDMSLLSNKSNRHSRRMSHLDDLDALVGKRILTNSFRQASYTDAKRISLDDSFDVLVKKGNERNYRFKKAAEKSPRQLSVMTISDTLVDLKNKSISSLENISYFFEQNNRQEEHDDVFEKVIETSFATNKENINDDVEYIMISDEE